MSKIVEFDGERLNTPYDDICEALLSSFLIELGQIYNSNYKDTKFPNDFEPVFGVKNSLFCLVANCFYNYRKFSGKNPDIIEDNEENDIGERLNKFLLLLNEYVQKATKDHEVVFFETAKIVERYTGFLRLIRKEYQLKDLTWIKDNDHYFRIPFKHNSTENIVNCELREFYNAYKKVAYKLHYLQFDWGLSSGENAILDLYSKFHKIHRSINDDEKNLALRCGNVILLIDEADMLFHPQWQQDYVKETLGVIKQIFRNYNGVQVIISSHSPIMLSDIPKQNIIYLKKDACSKTTIVPREERHETFDANIFRLFRDTFFLDSTGIGSFAEEKMLSLLKKIHSISNNTGDDEIYEIKKYIGIIGDPYLMRKFEQEFCNALEKVNPNKGKKERLAYLKAEVTRLEAECEQS